MRVLQLHTTYRELGGEDVVVASEADLLRAAGHEVVQRIAANPTGLRPTLVGLGAAPWNRRAARAVERVIHRERPDVAAVHNTWFALSPSVVATLARHGVPVVLTLHQYRLMCPAGTLFHHGQPCLDCVGSHPWHAVAHRCYRDSAALSGLAALTVESWRRSGAQDGVTRFAVMTESGRQLFVRGGLPAEKLVVRPHGIADPGRGSTPPSASDRLVYAGRAVVEKGLDELLRWWVLRPRPWVLEVIGDGPLLGPWRSRAPAGVVFHGTLPRPAVLAAMRGARAVVVPSLWEEPFGLVAVEAMACGVGVLSSGTGGLADLHGDDGGWVAPPGDHAAWDAAVDGLTDDVVDAAGAAARRRYEERFTLEQASTSLQALYAEAIAAAG